MVQSEPRLAPDGYSLDDPSTVQSRLLSTSDNENGYVSLDGDVHLASVDEKKRLWWKNATINTLFIAAWFFFATVLSLYNKWMFAEDHLNFPYPLFVTSLHMLVQFLMAAAIRAIWPARFKPARRPTPTDYGKKVAPTAVATCLDIGLSNLSLKTISLSFYTMVKSSSLIFVLAFAFAFRLEIFSWRLIGVIIFIFAGVLLMVATQTHFVLSGFILVLSASALGGLRWGLTQLLLKQKKLGLDNPAATIYYLSPAMGITLVIISLTLESWSDLIHSAFFDSFWKGVQTAMFLISPGIIAFCMVLSEFYILQRAGIVPMSIAGIAKEVTTISISAWFFGDELTPLNITGVAITLCGIALFAYHKYRKSIESTVPLDAHGNPLADDTADVHQEYQVELDETAHLASIRLSGEYSEGVDSHTLFSAEEEDDGDGDFRHERPPKTSVMSGGESANGFPPNGQNIRGSQDPAEPMSRDLYG